MKVGRSRLFGVAAAALVIAGTLAAPVAARASEDGRRNTMLGLGALTGYLFTRGGSKAPAFIGAAGTAYAYKRYDDSVRGRHARERRLRAYRARRHRVSYYRHRRHR